jgi:uncharacterized protein YjiS (DUF1127 family)
MACTTANTHFAPDDNARAASPIDERDKHLSPVRRFFHRIARQKHRRALLHLDDHLLKDIGITRERALLEASKWFWQD